MVVDAFFALLTTLINAVFSALPVWTLQPNDAAIGSLFFNLTIFNSVLPVTELFFMFSLFTTVFLSINALKWGKALINIVRGSGA